MASNLSVFKSIASPALKWGLVAGAVMAGAGVLNYALAPKGRTQEPGGEVRHG